MKIRALCYDDYDKNYYGLINQLFKLPKIDVSKEEFIKIVDQMISQDAHTYVIVDSNEKIVATGKIIIEQKSHGSKMGIIEDVVVDKENRGSGAGKKIIGKLIEMGERKKCYKVVLNCNDNNVGFYEKCGLVRKGVEMTHYYKVSQTIDH